MSEPSQGKLITNARPSPAKALQARILCDSDTLDALWEMHDLFHILVADLTKRLWNMRRGRPHPACRKLVEMMLEKGAQSGSFSILEPLSDPNWKPGKQYDWTPLVLTIKDSVPRRVLFDRKDWTVNRLKVAVGGPRSKADSPDYVHLYSEFWRKACEMSVQLLHTYDELKKNWRKGRDEWLKERVQWFLDNPGFEKVLPRFKQFEDSVRQQLTGKFGADIKHAKSGYGKRWQRWHLFYEWLTAPEQGDLVAWRGKATAADFEAIPDEDARDIVKANPRQDKMVFALIDCLRGLNPELDALLENRRTYIREYERFKRPPTYTRPSADKHPAWFTFKAGSSYKIVDLEKGLAEFLIQPAIQGEKYKWLTLNISANPRMRPSHRAERGLPPFIDLTGNTSWALLKRAKAGESPAATITGAKLQFGKTPSGRASKKKGAYLTFTINEQPVLSAIKLIKKKKTDPLASCCSFRDCVDRPLVVAAFDLGVRHLAAAATLSGKRSADGKWTTALLDRTLLPEPSASLDSVARHQRQLRRLRGLRGKAVKGERSNIALQDHITDTKKDRVKKGARAIVDYAKARAAHVIVLEEMSRFLPTAEDERWANEQLRRWNHRAIAQWVRMLAEAEGLLVFEVGAWGTSRFCSRCGARGARWSMRSRKAALAAKWFSYRRTLPKNRPPHPPSPKHLLSGMDFDTPVLDPGGHLFICLECHYRAQADLNAAVNIAKRFFGDLPPYRKGELDHVSPESQKIAELFSRWAADVTRRKHPDITPADSPAPGGKPFDPETPW